MLLPDSVRRLFWACSLARPLNNDTIRPNPMAILLQGHFKTHCLFTGLQYTVPLVDTLIALTRHKPLTFTGTANGMGVNGE